MIIRQRLTFLICFAVLGLLSFANASTGDRLPEFKQCVEVCQHENCDNGFGGATKIPLLHRLLFWTCPAECDYTCQHIITNARVKSGQPIVQFHGKWPFYRFLGMQEPFSVFFSLLNFLAHQNGLAKITAQIPETYSMRKYYVMLSYAGMISWVASMVFHTRDYPVTEQLDYFAAGGSVLYGMYYTPIRIFRMDRGGKRASSVLRAWTLLCILFYTAHVVYLKWWDWDYTYNMAANVVVGVLQNSLWSWFSFEKYRKSKRAWTALPGLWHLGTVAPTMIFYSFLLKDAQDDIAGQRLKA
ncbi:hypothetical protein DID88_001245 [Monilinia fructigena]|uniref:Post-GPI attachment to proteins factor 3 n=1 Tax=Monilinia fructigena TaxID=38457 RepID=A0A395J399_9HELO|nr:hypothetical protein DID88_001245 [Monilinia fructigena]